jgi:hypothetical protein
MWEIAHMTTLVKADSRGRVPIRGTKNRQQYLVTAENGGWWVMPAPKVRTPPRENLDAPLVKPRRTKEGWLMMPRKFDRAKLVAAIRADRDAR